MVRTEGNEAAAVATAVAGDAEAFRVLVAGHSRSIFRLAYRMTGNEQDAETEVRQKVSAALSATEPAVFVMRPFEGLLIEEICRALGLRASATKNAIFRAVQKLRRALEPVVATRR
ncbi:MAG: hypothetical protein K6U02_08125 [Firmicutes bacterium]|nr:hypothetical protein [Bacillota bacterium]